MTLRPLALAAVIALASPLAFAQTGVSATAGGDADARDDARGTALRDRTCLRHTGTRIQMRAPTPANDAARASRRDCLAGNGRVYSRSDIDGTGRTDLGDALRALDPSIR